MKKSFADILNDVAGERERKVASKLPAWADVQGLEFPSALCLEQCSSSAAAAYKASLLSDKGSPGLRIADLTGGLGVDSSAFAAVAEKVAYFERNAELAAAAAHNFGLLGKSNIEVHNLEISAESADWLEVLRTFRPDWIFADPARRDSAGRKVFLLEDCQPDILTLLPTLAGLTPHLMLKLSPMADLTMLSSRFGAALEEIRIIGLDGECKELLCTLDLSRSEGPGPSLYVVELGADGGTLEFAPGDVSQPLCAYAGKELAGSMLLEPSASLVKSGRLTDTGARYGLLKLDRFTHLFAAPSLPAGLRPFFKTFLVEEVLPFDKTSIKSLGQRYKRAEVTARNLPLSSEELRSRLGCKTGSDIHIFGCTVSSERVLIVARRVRDVD